MICDVVNVIPYFGLYVCSDVISHHIIISISCHYHEYISPPAITRRSKNDTISTRLSHLHHELLSCGHTYEFNDDMNISQLKQLTKTLIHTLKQQVKYHCKNDESC